MSHRCIKPQCPIDCSECNHALPEEDEAAMLVCDLLDAFAVDGFDGPLEDGESQLVDRARAWLATRHIAKEAIKQHDAEPVAWRWRSPMARNGEWQLTDVNPKDWGTTLGIEFEPLYLSAPSIPEGWQPIETAPKDKQILLWVDYWSDGQGSFQRPLIGMWNARTERWECMWAGWFSVRPTHWMPLPASPQPTKGGKCS